MASMSTRSVGVTLRNDKEKAQLKNLSPPTSQPSRYSSLAVIKGLGIQQCWDTLVRGRLLPSFPWEVCSYKALTVEFLSTLQLIYSDEEELEAITFRHTKKEITLTPAQFNAIFKVYGDQDRAIWQEPEDFDRDWFWLAITRQRDSTARFNPSRAKSSEIRNPVLRYMHKALVNLSFAHTESGSVQTEKLFV